MSPELRRFPKEVLNEILQYELDLQFDNELPRMLLALAPDKELFDEAYFTFKKINANVTVRVTYFSYANSLTNHSAV